MIHTRYGSEVRRIILLDFSTGYADFITENNPDIFKGFINQLVADGGIDEIEKAAEKVIK